VEYFHDKGLKEDVMAHLAKHPSEDTAAIAAVIQSKQKQKELQLEWEEPPVEWSWDDQFDSLL
jgi:hypothetical protein